MSRPVQLPKGAKFKDGRLILHTKTPSRPKRYRQQTKQTFKKGKRLGTSTS